MEDVQKLLEIINDDIKEILSEKRYTHSVNVMKRAEELAIKFNVDINKAKLVGLAHDIGKEILKKIEYANANGIEIDEIEKESPELLHSKIGAEICGKKYGFTQDMQDAIKYHTTGNPEMDDLAKVLFIADKTEAGRTYLDFDKIKQKEDEGLDAEMIYLIDQSILYTIKKGELLHPDSIYTRNRFLTKKG